nr:uncharacterized protein LOC111510341 [Leptinotarsa decemlineata]
MGNVKLSDEEIEVIRDLDKQFLEKMLKEDTPADDVDDEIARSDKLLTVCECEAVINARPLTYLPENNDDLVPLTPSIFMQDIKETDLDNINADSTRRHWKYLQKLREMLRRRFRNEYLSQLILFNNRKQIREVKVGDLVLIENEDLKRLDLPLGIIEEILVRKDGKIRLVRLRTSNGHLMRPIQRLYPLELDIQESELLKLKFRSNRREGEREKKVQTRAEPTETQTRSGRIVHQPNRLTY